MLSKEQLYNDFVSDFSTILYNLKSEDPFSDFVFLCVGSDRITGDAFGPIVGDKLQKLFKNYYHNIEVVGTLDNPVSAVNIEKELETIKKKYENPCIIAIDSALATKEQIGKIFVSEGTMKLGAGTNKRIQSIGDISIKGVVSKDYKFPNYNFNGLQSTPLGLVMRLANTTADGIYQVIKYR